LRGTTTAPTEAAPSAAYSHLTQASASISAQVIGGCLIAIDPLGLGWRVVFLVNVPIGLAVLLASRRAIPESRSPAATQIDLRGVALVSMALGLVLVPAIEGRELGWPPWIFAVGVAVVGTVFYAVLARGGEGAFSAAFGAATLLQGGFMVVGTAILLLAPGYDRISLMVRRGPR